MDATLTPALALDYLRELSTDLRAGAVLDAAGNRLAGSPDMATAVGRLAVACRDAEAVEVGAEDGCACLLTSARHMLGVVVGRFALAGLLFHDMTVVLALLEGSAAPRDEIDAGPGAGGRSRPPGETTVRWCPPGGRTLVVLSPADPRHAAIAAPGRALLRGAAVG